MKITGAQVIYLVYVGFVLWVGLKSSWEAYCVLRGRTTDRHGKPLWFYMKIDGLPVVAKNRNQALVLTVGMTVCGFILAAPALATILRIVILHAR